MKESVTFIFIRYGKLLIYNLNR